MLPLYAARIEDLGPGDFIKVDCAACHHIALLTPEALLRAGLIPAAKGSRSQRVAPVSGLWQEGASGRFGEVARAGGMSRSGLLSYSREFSGVANRAAAQDPASAPGVKAR
jgi:hypothetical protein